MPCGHPVRGGLSNFFRLIFAIRRAILREAKQKSLDTARLFPVSHQRQTLISSDTAPLLAYGSRPLILLVIRGNGLAAV
jgi:hypothetical protein